MKEARLSRKSPPPSTKNELSAEQLKLLNHALQRLDMRYRQGFTGPLSDWILHHPKLCYDKDVEARVKKIIDRYPQIACDDWRCEKLFRVSTHRYFCETNRTCAPSAFVDSLDNRAVLEANIAFGFLALVWQVNLFAADIIQTPSLMAQRYPLQESGKKSVISPN